ncbi:MAG: glycosyltransferase family 2 protein [Planctomycetota bacterium]|nr:glycosyltransferase family 2 protein [Planctomycetota bacterium]
MTRPKISVCVITLNEERNLGACLESVRWADEIIVVDSFSTDRTVEIAWKHTDKVQQRRWSGINEQRNFALSLATGDWVLSIDADERVSPELRAEIEKTLSSPPPGVCGFYVPRLARYLGRWIRHGGWYPDWKLRLFRRECARYAGKDPHDVVKLACAYGSVSGSAGTGGGTQVPHPNPLPKGEGESGCAGIPPAGETAASASTSHGATRRLHGDLLHYTYRSFSDQLQQINTFSSVGAAELFEAGRRFRLAAMILHPIGKFFGTYFLRLGFLDGLPGLIVSVASAFYVFARHVKLWEAGVPPRVGANEP